MRFDQRPVERRQRFREQRVIGGAPLDLPSRLAKPRQRPVRSAEQRGDLRLTIGCSYDMATVDLGASIACSALRTVPTSVMIPVNMNGA